MPIFGHIMLYPSLKASRAVSHAALLALGALFVAACGEGVLPESGKIVYLRGDSPAPEASRKVEVPKTSLSAEELARYQPIVDSFRENAPRLLRREDIAERIEHLETVFGITGNYLDLLAIYQQDVATHGMQSPVAYRLAWTYLQLGQRQMARPLIDKLLAHDPEEAAHHVLEGAYWLDDAQQNAEAAQKTVQAWTRALALGVEHVAIPGLDAAALSQRIAELRAANPQMGSLPPIVPPAPAAATSDAPEGPAQPPAAAQDPEDPEAPVASAPAAQAPQAPEAPAAPAPVPVAESTAVRLARAQMMLDQGNARGASELFGVIARAEPDSVEARLGLLQSAIRGGMPPGPLAEQARQLAQNPALKPRHAYELGLLCLRGLKQPELARELFARVRREDPALAERLKLDNLLR